MEKPEGHVCKKEMGGVELAKWTGDQEDLANGGFFDVMCILEEVQ